MFLRWLVAIPAAAALLAQSAPQPASVSGTVTNSLTGEPILRAHVMAHCMSGGRQPESQIYGALSNVKGEFSIAPLPSGNCSLEAQRVGFVAPMRQESSSIGDGSHKENVKLTLIPAGAITGRVVNAAGEPAQWFNVTAEAGGNSEGATTDDKGQFRIGGLRPGKYRVKAGKEWLPIPPEIRADGSMEMRDATTYYPESLSAKTAQQLDVKPGAEVSGIEIKLLQTPIVKVSGKVTGMPPGARTIMVQTMPSGQGAATKPDGTFVIWRMDPGKYTLQAQHWTGQSQQHSAPLEIEVTTSNIENLELRMMPPFEIVGQLRFDDEQARMPLGPPTRADGTGAPAPPREPRRVWLQSISQQNGAQFQTTIGADDSFTEENVQPGRYRVMLHGVSGYVQSVRAGNTEMEGDILDARNGSPGPVTITVSSNYSELSGTVTDSKGPAADATIVLVAAEDPMNVQTARTNSAGVYKIRTPPGKYKLAVVDEDGMSWGMQGPDLDNYDAESIELNAGDKITKDLVRK